MQRKTIQPLLVHIGLFLVCLLVLAPVLFALAKSTQTRAEVFHFPPKLGPGTALIENYSAAWNAFGLAQFMKNTLVVALIVTVGKTIFSMLAGLALVYFAFPLKGPIFYFILFTLMMPTEIMIVALFNLVSELGWGNTVAALTVPFLASATGVFLFRQHFSGISPELVDAARIDGAGPLRFLWSILLPMSTNAIGALALVQFIYMWNQYIWPLVIMRDNSRQLVQVGLRSMTAFSEATNWGVVMAGAILAMLPPLVVFIFLQEQFTHGFAFGQDK